MPVPFSPTTATSSPGTISRSSPARTVRRPNDLRIPRAASAVMVSASFRRSCHCQRRPRGCAQPGWCLAKSGVGLAPPSAAVSLAGSGGCHDRPERAHSVRRTSAGLSRVACPPRPEHQAVPVKSAAGPRGRPGDARLTHVFARMIRRSIAGPGDRAEGLLDGPCPPSRTAFSHLASLLLTCLPGGLAARLSGSWKAVASAKAMGRPPGQTGAGPSSLLLTRSCSAALASNTCASSSQPLSLVYQHEVFTDRRSPIGDLAIFF